MLNCIKNVGRLTPPYWGAQRSTRPLSYKEDYFQGRDGREVERREGEREGDRQQILADGQNLYIHTLINQQRELCKDSNALL